MGHQKSKIEDEISKLQENRDALKSSIDDLAQDEYKLNFKLYDLQNDVKEQEENAQKVREEKEKAEQDIKDLEKDKNALEGQIRGLKDDINKQNATIIEQRGIIKKLGTMGNTLLEPFRRIIGEFFGRMQHAKDVPAVEQARSDALEQIDRPAEPIPLTAAEMDDRIKAKKDVYVIESGKEITLNKETLEADRRKYLIHVIDGEAVAFAEPRGLGGIEPIQTMAKDAVNEAADEKINEIHKRQHRGR
jgi:exonuclease SbcC